jgi:hypothetical protein
MEVHIGEVIKAKVLEQKLRTADVADFMDLHPGSIPRIYDNRTMQTTVLWKVCNAMRFDFFGVLSASLNDWGEVEGAPKEVVSGVVSLEGLLEEKNVKIESLEKEIAYLKEINGFLRGN